MKKGNPENIPDADRVVCYGHDGHDDSVPKGLVSRVPAREGSCASSGHVSPAGGSANCGSPDRALHEFVAPDAGEAYCPQNK